MFNKRYKFNSPKTVITDYGDGRVYVHYKKSPKDAPEAIRLARWVTETVLSIHKHLDMPLRIVTDVRRLDKPILNSDIRNIYQEAIESGCIERLATVGPQARYYKLATIKILLLRHRDCVSYFTTIEEGKQWVRW